MASKSQMTGMVGVYLVAAELSKRNWIVSVTSRGAAGADLLVTDHQCKTTWSVQVKTNAGNANFWLLSPNAKTMGDESHMYVFVNLGDPQKKRLDEFIVVPSGHVKEKMTIETSKTGSIWYSFARKSRKTEDAGWDQFKTQD